MGDGAGRHPTTSASIGAAVVTLIQLLDAQWHRNGRV
jgi:hypothetical protein